MKESEAGIEKIAPTMALHKHVDGVATIFATILVPLDNNPLDNWLGMIIRGTYQSASEDSRW